MVVLATGGEADKIREWLEESLEAIDKAYRETKDDTLLEIKDKLETFAKNHLIPFAELVKREGLKIPLPQMLSFHEITMRTLDDMYMEVVDRFLYGIAPLRNLISKIRSGEL